MENKSKNLNGKILKFVFIAYILVFIFSYSFFTLGGTLITGNYISSMPEKEINKEALSLTIKIIVTIVAIVCIIFFLSIIHLIKIKKNKKNEPEYYRPFKKRNR